MIDRMKAYRALMKLRPDWFERGADDGLELVLDEAELDEARAELARDYPEYGEDGIALGVLFDSPHYTVLRDAVRRPNGSYGGYVRVFNAPALPEGIWLMPTLGEDLILTREFRHPVRGWRWQIPRGFCNAGESGEDAARRELREELNAEAVSIRLLGSIEPDPGVLGTRPRVFHAAIETFEAAGLEDEAISEARRFSTADLKAAVASGELVDGPTLSALGLWWALH